MPNRFLACLVSVGLCWTGPCLSSVLMPSSVAATPDPGVSSAARRSAAASTPFVAVPSDRTTALFVVVLRDAPLASYRGEIEGYGATTPVTGRRYDARRPAVVSYRDRLIRSQSRVLAAIGSPATVYSYTTVLNGFAAELTSGQVKRLESMPAVLAVEPERDLGLDSAVVRPKRRVLESRSPEGGRTAQLPTGLRQAWRSTGGVSRAGDGVVVGVVDSGIWPENPTFAAAPLDRAQRRTRFAGFTGGCDRGEHWDAETCTEKVLAARYFVEGFGRSNVAAADFVSARDGSGHGSHTAATAAGNAGVDVTIEGQKFGRVTGVAPGAALAIYKACWTAPDPRNDGCSSVDILKAIDSAVSDGVDVLSYSISGESGDSTYTAPASTTSSLDVIELAFYHAADAGVFIATSAGDRGPNPATVTSANPWVTTVAATTQGSFEGSIRLRNGITLPGSIVSDEGTPTIRLVDAAEAATTGSTRREAALCTLGSLDAAKVKGGLVLCDRGVASRLSKSMAVSQAGGAAMVLANDRVGHTYADVHSVPTLHVTHARGKAITRYIAGHHAPRASLLPAPAAAAAAAAAAGSKQVADFSSRGPAPNDGPLKPDIAAPGASVLGAVAPPSNLGRLWDLHSGTSMAAPQVAGVAALVRSEHPDWSPAAVKSALMTTANRLAQVSPFDQGAGELDPSAALDPGLVYDTDPGEMQRGGTRLNAAAIAIGSLVGDRVATRSVTNVSGLRERFVASSSGLHGIGVAVSPPALKLDPGETRSFEVSFSARSSAHYGEYAVGTLTWTGSRGHLVKSPIVIQPEHVSAPLEAHGTSAGPFTVTARAGVTGTVRTSVHGPVGTLPVPLQLQRRFFDAQHPSVDSGAAVQSFVVPNRTAAVRFEVASQSGAAADVDLHVYRNGRLVAQATGESGKEQVTLTDPDPGDYDAYVNAPPADGRGAAVEAPTNPIIVEPAPIGVIFTGWVVPETTVTPVSIEPTKARVTGGRRFSVDIDPSGLAKSQRWFGAMTYDKSSDITFVTVN